MFSYNSADITYTVIFGKGDCSSSIDYSVDLNKKEAGSYTKARMLGQDLNGVMDTYRIEREIVRYEKDEYGTDIRNARVSISFCNNQEQPPIEDVKAYLKDLLKARKYEAVHDVVIAQTDVFEDTDNDWHHIALELAKENNCPGYIKKYKDDIFNEKSENVSLEPVSEELKEAIEKFNGYFNKIRTILNKYDEYGGLYLHSKGFYYVVRKRIDGKKYEGVIGHTGEILLPCKYASLFPNITDRQRKGKVEQSIKDIFIYQEEEKGLFGLIKIDGTIVLKPSFGIIKEYDFKHNVIIAGEDRNHLGVFSLGLGKFIVPCKYEYISFWESDMHCRFNSGSAESWNDYDYDGNLIK